MLSVRFRLILPAAGESALTGFVAPSLLDERAPGRPCFFDSLQLAAVFLSDNIFCIENLSADLSRTHQHKSLHECPLKTFNH